MNKEVIIKDGIVNVKDHNGDIKEVTLIDNLDEVLIVENVIEIMEKVITELEYCSSVFKKNKLIDLLYVESPITSTILVPTIAMYLNTGSLDGIIDTKFGSMDKTKFLVLFITVFTPIAIRMSKKWYQEYIEEAKFEKGRQLALYHLKENLTIQNKKLNNLKRDSKEITVEEDKRYHLDEEVIDILQDHINLYYELGYNIKEYYEYFRINGHLPDEVRSEYNDAGVKIIEDYLKVNGNKIKKIGSKK